MEQNRSRDLETTTPIRLPRTEYSEAVVRKSLYWLSEDCEWQLNIDEENWVIILSADNAAISKLHRLLNDFSLREKLDERTGTLRNQVIDAALTRLASNGK